MTDEIFIYDLGIFVNVRRSSIYELLLWKVIDTRDHARLRNKMIVDARVGSAMPRTITPTHYYFSSPKAAALILKETFDFEKESVQAFYERRDTILRSLNLNVDNWYHAPMFQTKLATPKARAIISREFLNDIKMNRNGAYYFAQDVQTTEGSVEND